MATLKTLADLFHLLNTESLPENIHHNFVQNSEGIICGTLYIGNYPSEGILLRANPWGGQSVGYNLPIRNMSSYQTLTGKQGKDLNIDFYFHWLTNWDCLSTKESLKEAMSSLETAASPAVMIALNKWQHCNIASDDEVRNIIKGCPCRWVKEETGWRQTRYSSSTRHPNGVDSIASFPSVHASIFTHNHLAGLKRLNIIANRYVAAQQECQGVVSETIQEELLNYTARATDFFSFKYGKKKQHTIPLGVELELENHSQREFVSLRVLKNHAIMKRDGSVRTGVEICTAPATLDVHLEEFKPFFDALQTNNSRLAAQENCGLHVHIDKSKMTALHIANLCLLLNNSENESNITHIAGRAANSYCNIYTHTYKDFNPRAREATERYRRVNLTNRATVELRMFASTTDYATFRCRLEFTQAAVDYTQPGILGLGLKAIPLWSNFAAYVKGKGYLYPQLFKTMFPELVKKERTNAQI